MPIFADIQDNTAPVRKLSAGEIVNAIQTAITSEYDTYRIYQKILSSTDAPAVRDVMNDLIDGAMHNAGALLKLLYDLSPDMARRYEIGAQKALHDMGLAGILPGASAQ